MDRRTALTALGAVGIGLAGTAAAKAATASHVSAGAQPSVTAGTTAACVLTPEETAGPYYLSYEMVRRDITEDYPGVPLILRVVILDTRTCAPLPGAALDLALQCPWRVLRLYEPGDRRGQRRRPWCPAHGDPDGHHPSPPPGGGGGHVNPTDKLTFLRGVQLTDHRGVARFRTIFPGWYAWAAPSISM